jgi:hypothetical protein
MNSPGRGDVGQLGEESESASLRTELEVEKELVSARTHLFKAHPGSNSSVIRVEKS